VNEPYTLFDAAYGAARWGWYIAAFLLIGAGSYAPVLGRVRPGAAPLPQAVEAEFSQRAARLGLLAALALLPLAALRLWLQSRSLLDPGEPITGEFLGAVLGSTWGHGWVRQGAMSVVALVAFGLARSGGRLAWAAAAMSGAGLALTAGMTGHAATEKAGTLGLLLDGAHLWCGGLWLGGLAVLLGAGIPGCRALPDDARGGAIRGIVGGFSRRALVAAPLTVLLGAGLAVRHIGWGWPLHLLDRGYGWALLAKLAALAVVGALGAWNWRVVQPSLGSAAGEPRLRRSGRLELLAGALLLAATAVLVALPLPGEAM
jgi:putative copper resistance protein D